MCGCSCHNMAGFLIIVCLARECVLTQQTEHNKPFTSLSELVKQRQFSQCVWPPNRAMSSAARPTRLSIKPTPPPSLATVNVLVPLAVRCKQPQQSRLAVSRVGERQLTVVVQRNAAQHCTAQHSTAQHYSVPVVARESWQFHRPKRTGAKSIAVLQQAYERVHEPREGPPPAPSTPTTHL